MEEIQKQVDKVNTEVPREYLVPCLWMDKIGDDTQSELLRVNQENNERLKKCYLLHNSWIEYHKSTQGK